MLVLFIYFPIIFVSLLTSLNSVCFLIIIIAIRLISEETFMTSNFHICDPRWVPEPNFELSGSRESEANFVVALNKNFI